MKRELATSNDDGEELSDDPIGAHVCVCIFAGAWNGFVSSPEGWIGLVSLMRDILELQSVFIVLILQLGLTYWELSPRR